VRLVLVEAKDDGVVSAIANLRSILITLKPTEMPEHDDGIEAWRNNELP